MVARTTVNREHASEKKQNITYKKMRHAKRKKLTGKKKIITRVSSFYPGSTDNRHNTKNVNKK